MLTYKVLFYSGFRLYIFRLQQHVVLSVKFCGYYVPL